MKEEDLLRTNGDNEDDNDDDDNIDGKWWWQSINIKYILEKYRHMTITCRIERIGNGELQKHKYIRTQAHTHTYTQTDTQRVRVRVRARENGRHIHSHTSTHTRSYAVTHIFYHPAHYTHALVCVCVQRTNYMKVDKIIDKCYLLTYAYNDIAYKHTKGFVIIRHQF